MNPKEKIAILTDTGSFISPSVGEQLGIWVLPLQIIETENEKTISYEDLVDINTNDIYEKLYQNKELKTSLPSYYAISDTLELIKEKGYDSIIAIPLTSGISSTATNIQSVANELNIPISIIDTYTTCQIQNHVVKEVIDLVNKGYNRETIVEMVEEQIKNSNSVILAKDINHLKKGGRLTPAAAAFANMLKIFPILEMNHTTAGRIDVLNKVRTEKKAKAVLIEETVKRVSPGDYDIYVIHSDDKETAEYIKSQLISFGMQDNDIHIADFSSVIAVHVGMKCLAIQVIKKINY
ncbi:MAG: DegV family protein [Erysipelotrichales bacterium]|nr:DegV family protein [Erysipelotrichales bacterium]